MQVSNPISFKFEEIKLYLSKIASLEVDIKAFNPALDKKKAFLKPAAPNRLLGLTTATFKAPQLNPDSVLHRPKAAKTRLKGELGKQMPLGYKPTQGEVDDLIKKFTRIKLNRIEFLLIAQAP